MLQSLRFLKTENQGLVELVLTTSLKVMKYKELEKINFIKNKILNLKNLNILELGVQKGNSTKMFLEICNKNNGKLISIDIDDCSNVAKDQRWTFLHTSDDNFNYIDNFIKNKLDVIFIDSLHEPNHVKKVFYHYYDFLNLNGLIFIDDVSWLHYVKNSIGDNDFIERTNRLTFNKILEIYNSNKENITLDFNFQGSGLAIISKLNNQLNKEKKIKNRLFTIKNLIKNIYSRKPKK